MAIFEKDASASKGNYIALLDPQGEMVAIINPMRGISQELMEKSLLEVGLNVEIRESKADRVELSLITKSNGGEEKEEEKASA